MISFKNHSAAPGFSVMEVMIALLIGSAALGGLLTTQWSSLRVVYRSASLEQIYVCLNTVFEQAALKPLRGDATTRTTPFKDPELSVIYREAECPKESPFRDISGIKLQEVKAEWTLWGRKRTEVLLGYCYRPGSVHEK